MLQKEAVENFLAKAGIVNSKKSNHQTSQLQLRKKQQKWQVSERTGETVCQIAMPAAKTVSVFPF